VKAKRKDLLTGMAKASPRAGARIEHRRRAKERSASPEDTLSDVKALMAEPPQAKSTR